MTDNDTTLEIPESELYEVYKLLTAATTGASTGDPNKCAKNAADAKDKVVKIYEEAKND